MKILTKTNKKLRQSFTQREKKLAALLISAGKNKRLTFLFTWRGRKPRRSQPLGPRFNRQVDAEHGEGPA